MARTVVKVWKTRGTRHGILEQTFDDGSKRSYFYNQGITYWTDANGWHHREDGPAIIDIKWKPIRRWYYHGEQILCSSQAEFERILKLKGFW